MNSKAYSARNVNQVYLDAILQGRDGQDLWGGVDVGKYHILLVLHWGEQDFERPWKIENPYDIRVLITMLLRLSQGRKMVLAMEPSGTYGDVLRQAATDENITVHRVSPKAAHDYAEIFDGVPSLHDGKDAAVVAELARLGKSAVKAMGLNLAERSSGIHTGKLKISKRGSGVVRYWMYLAALRLIKKNSPVRPWYLRKKQRDAEAAGRALVAIMRRLGLALYNVAARGEAFDAKRLFPGKAVRRTDKRGNASNRAMVVKTTAKAAASQPAAGKTAGGKTVATTSAVKASAATTSAVTTSAVKASAVKASAAKTAVMSATAKAAGVKATAAGTKGGRMS